MATETEQRQNDLSTELIVNGNGGICGWSQSDGRRKLFCSDVS